MSYEDIYNNYYVQSPKIASIITGALLAIFGLTEVGIATDGFSTNYHGILEFLVGHGAYISAIAALIVWWLAAFLIACAIRFALKIAISQKIVVVNRLTKIIENTQDK